MADDLKRFIFEEKENFRRYKSNIDAIIKKYDRHFPDDAEIDLTTLTSCSSRDERVVRKLKTKPFGHSKLLVTKKKELSESIANGSLAARDESVFSLISDCDSSMHDTTLQCSSPSRLSPASNLTYTRENLSIYQDKDLHLETEDSEFLALKTSYFEIISEKNEEPSDAETLSSYSSDDLEDLTKGDDSEDGDDEDSQADDKIPCLPDVICCDSTSLSSAEDSLERIKYEKNKQEIAYKPDEVFREKNKRIFDIKKQINSLQNELKIAKATDDEFMRNKLTEKYTGLTDEVDGNLPVKVTDKSGFCVRDSIMPLSHKDFTGDRYQLDIQHSNRHGLKAERNFKKFSGDQIKFQTADQNERIEQWLENIKTEKFTQNIEFDSPSNNQNENLSNQTYVVCKTGENEGRHCKIPETRNFIPFASPGRLYKKMKENKVGVAAKMFSHETERNKSGSIEKHIVSETKGKEQKQIIFNQLPQRIPKMKETVDFFIAEDEIITGCSVKEPKIQQINPVARSVPAIKTSGVEFFHRQNNRNVMSEEIVTDQWSHKSTHQQAQNCTHSIQRQQDFSSVRKDFNPNKSPGSTYKLQTVMNIPYVIDGYNKMQGKCQKIMVERLAAKIQEPERIQSEQYPNQNTKRHPEQGHTSDLSYSPLKFKRPARQSRHKFVPVEDSVKLIQLMLNPDPNVATLLSPRKFHEKFDKSCQKEIKPVAETRKCLSSREKRIPVKDSHVESTESFSNRWRKEMVSAQEKSHKFQNSLKCNKSKQKVVFSQFYSKDKNEKEFEVVNSGVFPTKESTVGRSFGRFRCQDEQNNSPYRSAKDLSSIELYSNSSFYSPDFQRSPVNWQQNHDTSQSVPAKLVPNISNNSATHDAYDACHFARRIETLSRTKLKARRSLKLIESNIVENSSEKVINEVGTREKNLSGSSSNHRTPCKQDPYNFSLNEASPSTIFSRLLLNTPSPGNRKHFTKFKTNLQQMTQSEEKTKTINMSEDAIFKKPSNTASVGKDKTSRTNLNNRYHLNIQPRKEKFDSEVLISNEENNRNVTQNKQFTKAGKGKLTIDRRESKSGMFVWTQKYSKEQPSSEKTSHRRKALFQSTPVKSNNMFLLDNTVSTIHDAMSEDESDSEVMTISNSP